MPHYRIDGDAAIFDQILGYLRQTRGFDFTSYKRSSLLRRVLQRMQSVGVSGFERYLDYLQVHQEEVGALFNTILINVTSFFRDPEVWAHLSTDVLPQLISSRAAREPVRIWSAGCASGQEPYSIAMLLAEHLGAEVVRKRVKIYATDVDDEALNEARHAVYAERHLSDVPATLVAKYFERASGQFAFNRELRRSVVFGRHDLIQDAPISRVDLLLCRNTLMYFTADAQTRVLARLYFSVNPGGYLLLGRSEMLFSDAATFTPVDLKRRLFTTVAGRSQREHRLALAQTGHAVMPNPHRSQVRIRDVTHVHVLQHEVQHSKRELETVYEELETTNEELQSAVEELETTNEALQSTNEELESTNEELRSLNDELRSRRSDLTSANAFVASIFAGLQSAVVVLDREYHVQVWNDRAEQLWGVRSDEANGTHFLGLDIGLPLAELKSAIGDVLNGTEDHRETILPAITHRGDPIGCRVSISPLRETERAIRGVIVLMEETQVPT